MGFWGLARTAHCFFVSVVNARPTKEPQTSFPLPPAQPSPPTPSPMDLGEGDFSFMQGFALHPNKANTEP